MVSNSTSDNLVAIRLTAKPQVAQTTPCIDDEMKSMRPCETDHVGTWEYTGPGYGWFRQSHKQTAEQFRSWLDKHPEYVTMARDKTRGLFMMSMCEVDDVDDSSKRLDSYVQEEKAMDEQQLQKRAVRLANIPFTIPSEQVPVNLSLAELKRGQQDDAQCRQWREMLETWTAGGAKAQDKPAEARCFALADDGVLMRLGYIGEEGEREVLRPAAPANLRPFLLPPCCGSLPGPALGCFTLALGASCPSALSLRWRHT